MALYNGEKFLKEQLESIYAQSVQPDEVILCDDGSTDRSVSIVRDFLKQHGLEASWHLYCNQENKGYPGNFYYAMGLCKGDLVFLADQDDLWAKDKLKVLAKVFQEKPEARLVCSKFGLIDAAGQKIHSMMNPSEPEKKKGLRGISLEEVFYKCEWPGMVMAYRRDWFAGKLQQWGKGAGSPQGIPHDFLLSAWAAEENGFFQTDEVLAWHRRHDQNAGGEEHQISRLLNKDRKLWEIRNYHEILNAFDREAVLTTAEGREILRRKRISMQQRYEALDSGKPFQVLKNAWTHRKMVRAATVICDLAITVQGLWKK